MVQQLPIAVYSCSSEGIIDFYNEAAETLWGRQPDLQHERWCGSYKSYDMHGNEVPHEESAMAIAIKEQRIINEELIIERPDGSRRWVIPNPQIRYDEEGRIAGAISTLIDITSQVENRRRIEESEKQFSTLANSIPNLAWIANADGWIFWYNKNWYDYTGTTEEDMEGWGWQSVHDPAHLPAVLEKWQASINTGKPFEMIFPIKGADGQFRSFLTRVYPILDKDGQVIRWFGTNTDINDHKIYSDRLEVNLKESEDQMQAILEHAPDAVISINHKGAILSWNPEAELVFGYTEEEVLGQSLNDIVFPSDTDIGLVRLLKSGNGPVINKPVEAIVRNKNNERFPVELKISSTLINDRQLYIVFIRDITIRKEAEETIQHKTDQLIEAQKLAHIGSWEWNVAANTIEWSDELYRIYGLNPDEFEANYENYLNCIHPEDREMVNAAVQKAFEDHQPFKLHHRTLPRDGETCYISSTGTVEVNEKGEVLKMAGTAQDVTEQKRREDELRASEERFFKIFDNNPISLILTEIDANIIRHVNNQFCDVFGYTKDEIIGKSSTELMSEEEYLRVSELFYHHLQDSRSLKELREVRGKEKEKLLMKFKKNDSLRYFEIQSKRKNGESFPALVSFELVSINNERFIVTSYQDITERKRTEEKLRRQNKQLEKINKDLESFTYVSSHDLQEPLRKIQLFAGRIAEQELEQLSEKGRDQFKRIQNAANKMQMLIQDLLSYSRANTVKGILETTELNNLAEEVKTDLKETIEDKKAEVIIGNLGKLPVLPFQMRQLFHNLMSNSLKFSKPGIPPKISISAETVNGNQVLPHPSSAHRKYKHLIFSDNGIGFESEYYERIFEVFQRLHGKDTYPGTGIGLAIVKKIVDNHHGQVNVRSKPGEGTTFDIYLPETP